MTEKKPEPVRLRTLITGLHPADFLEAIGPLLLAGVFSYVLYAIQVPVNYIVVIGIGLIYWPLYEVAGLLIERALVAIFIATEPEFWKLFRNGFYPLMVIVVLVGLFYFSQWFWLVIFAQLLSLLFSPPGEQQEKEGCFQSVITAFLIFIVFILVMTGVPESLSKQYHFPNVSRYLKYLPGMLIIGIGYYLCMAVLVVIIKPASRLNS